MNNVILKKYVIENYDYPSTIPFFSKEGSPESISTQLQGQKIYLSHRPYSIRSNGCLAIIILINLVNCNGIGGYIDTFQMNNKRQSDYIYCFDLDITINPNTYNNWKMLIGKKVFFIIVGKKIQSIKEMKPEILYNKDDDIFIFKSNIIPS